MPPAHDHVLAACEGRFAVLETRINNHSSDLKNVERTVNGDNTIENTGLVGEVCGLKKKLAHVDKLREEVDVKKWAIIMMLANIIIQAISTIALSYILKP